MIIKPKGLSSVHLILLFTTVVLCTPYAAEADYKILVNHLSTQLSDIPISEIEGAKANLHIAYQHTSHGSQLISGMNALENYVTFGDTYEWSDNGSSGLDLDDYGIPAAYPDLSQGDRIDENGVTPWVTGTRALLNDSANDHVNVIMWSWCSIAGHDIDRYLTNMEILISEYGEGGSNPRAAVNPVTFVFMTGHAEGGGEGDSSDSRNELIRQHCYENERVLFDFADIENYDPNGLYYLDKRITDDLDYDDEEPYDEGGRNGNWAIEYVDENPGSELTALTGICSSCAHSYDDPRKGLNCVLKGRAAWWMFARINGWNGGYCTDAATNLAAAANSIAAEITLSWDDNSSDEDSYIVHRQVNGGSWDTGYQALAANSTGFVDTSLSPGVYNYRVVAHRNDDGSGSPCDSSYSNSAGGEIESFSPPDGDPTNLTLSVDHTAGSIILVWNDNSSNEDSFLVQRQVDGGVWDDSYGSVAADIETFTDSGLAAGTYFYRVVASNSYGVSSASNTQGETVLAVPAAPTGLTVTGDPVAGTILLHWTDNASDETGYRISRQVDGGSWDEGYDSVAPDVTTYLDDNRGGGSLPSGTYGYRVAAINGSLASEPSNTATTVLSTSVPAAPSAIDSTVSGSDIIISWTDNSDNEDSFVLERNVNGGSWTERAVLAADAESYTDAALVTGMTYAYRVKASNSFGDSAYSGTTSKYLGVTTTTVRLQTTGEVDDAFLSSSSPDTNYGSTNYLSDIERFAIRFNLPAEVLNQKIVEARITFYGWHIAVPSPPHYLDLYPITSDWTETEVTWNNAAASVAWSTAGGDFSTPAVASIEVVSLDHAFFDSADITDLVQHWADAPSENHGLMVIKDPTATVGLKASEYNNDQRSYLEITYAPPIRGDIDDDGEVTLADALLGLKLLCSSAAGSELTARADVNGDGEIGMEEVVFIFRSLTGTVL